MSNLHAKLYTMYLYGYITSTHKLKLSNFKTAHNLEIQG
jgi:hypothetical protein